jgi:thiol-disulfide isomerase/thioredoxin
MRLAVAYSTSPISSFSHARRFRFLASFWLRSGGRARLMERVVQEYAPLRCSPKPTPSGIAKRVRQNSELARRANLKVMATACALIALSSLACSRNENTVRKTAPPALSEEAALGPLAELAPSASASAPSTPPLPVIDGPTLLQKIRDSGHKGVVVNAWASWCDPCQHELPMLSRVGPQLAAKGVPIWLVSVDDPDAFPAAKALLDSLHIELTSFAAAPPLQAFKVALNPKWPGMIPVSFLFDATGKMRYFWAGEVYEKELVPVVEGFVAGKHIDGVSDFGLSPGATQAGHD